MGSGFHCESNGQLSHSEAGFKDDELHDLVERHLTLAVLRIVNELPARRSDTAAVILVLLRIGAFGPAAYMREEDTVGPIGLGILQ